MTPEQIMLLDILTDRIITLATTAAQVKAMNDEQVAAELAIWQEKRKEEEKRLDSH